MSDALLVMGGYPIGTDAASQALAGREAAAQELVTQATAAYESRRYLAAARGFMAAAADLRFDEGRSRWESRLTENRLVCYTNAQLAWRQAAATAEARAAPAAAIAEARTALAAAALADPANAPSIQELLARLAPP